MQVIDPRELNDLAALAARGGLGHGVALTDCVAEEPDQLMYIQGDELVLLRDLGPILLASCEGVVGWIERENVRFDSIASTSKPTSPVSANLPRTVLTSPSPPATTAPLLEESLPRPEMVSPSKRVSGPFELESPQTTPGVEKAQDSFAEQQEADKRRSVLSVASSAFGEIGGFMMGDEERVVSSDGVERLDESGDFRDRLDPEDTMAKRSSAYSAQSDWDIYGDYARESMYVPKRVSISKRMSRVSKAASRTWRDTGDWSSDGESGAFEAARAALEKVTAKREAREEWAWKSNLEEATPPDVATPPPRPQRRRPIAMELLTPQISSQPLQETLNAKTSTPETPISAVPYGARSFAMEIRQRIRNQESTAPPSEVIHLPSPTRSASPGLSEDSTTRSSEGHHDSEASTEIETPQQPEQVILTPSSVPAETELPLSSSGNSFLASPLPLNEAPKSADQMASPSPHLVPPPPPGQSPRSSPSWSPNSPSSPHSVAATMRAVEVVRSTPEGKRSRGMTLVGRMEADLSAAKGPVPITFLVNGPGVSLKDVGLGSPPASGRRTPERRTTSPLVSPLEPPFADPIHELKNNSSPFPQIPQRSATNPVPAERPHSGPKAGFFPARPRSRSFSAVVSKAMGKGRKDPPALSINTVIPPVPAVASPSIVTPKLAVFAKNVKGHSSPMDSKSASPSKLSRSSSSAAISPGLPSSDSTLSLPPPSARSSSFSFSSKSSKTPRKASRPLPSPVSHKDYEDTVTADGMDFELVQPSKPSLLAVDNKPKLERQNTAKSNVSGSSMGHLAETDEWGFLKDHSTTPEIFQSRSAAGDHRMAEQKWLSIISTPLAPGSAPKKVRKLVLEAGVPSSLRGKVWAWFMAGQMSARVPGLYAELLDHDRGIVHEQMERDVASAFQDHSLFADQSSPGQADLRNILRAFSQFAPCGYKPQMSLLAGALLIHCVAEDAFWLLSGLINGALRDFYPKEGKHGLKVDSAVFAGVLQGSEPKIAKLFKDVGLHPIAFLEQWYTQVFIRCLPWPTTLRVIDAVVAEGPRFLLVASLTVLTLSRDRLLRLPHNRQAILAYLRDLPQDSLLLPETFMRGCENVRFKEEDLKRMRAAVEKEGMGNAA